VVTTCNRSTPYYCKFAKNVTEELLKSGFYLAESTEPGVSYDEKGIAMKLRDTPHRLGHCREEYSRYNQYRWI